MPIGINGSGTITGVSVGGLPDGIVDADMLASKAVTFPKRGANAPLQIVQNNTTVRLATSSSSFVASSHLVTITPLVASSKIRIQHTGEANSQSSGNHVYITVFRSIAGGTYTEIAPHGSVTNQGMSVIRSADARLQVPFVINFIDAPSYTLGDAITYKLYIRCPEGNLIEIPSSNDSNAIVNIAEEIAT